MSAIPAKHDRAESPPVQEEESLFLPLQRFPQRFLEPPGENGRVIFSPVSVFRKPHINDLDLGQRSFFDAVRHGKAGIFAAERIVIALDSGGCRTKDDRRPGHLCFDNGEIPGVVTNSVVLFVRFIVLLIHNHETQIPDGGKKSRAGAYNDPDVAALNTAPLIVADGGRDAAVQNGNGLSGKSLIEPSQKLGRQADFRNEEKDAAASFEDLLYRQKIDLRLAAARDPMEQARGKTTRIQPGHNPPQGRQLIIIRLERRFRDAKDGDWFDAAIQISFPAYQDVLFNQVRYYGTSLPR